VFLLRLKLTFFTFKHRFVRPHRSPISTIPPPPRNSPHYGTPTIHPIPNGIPVDSTINDLKLASTGGWKREGKGKKMQTKYEYEMIPEYDWEG